LVLDESAGSVVGAGRKDGPRTSSAGRIGLCRPEGGVRLVSFAIETLAQDLAIPADGLGLLAGTALARLFVGAAQLHLPEDAFALQLLLEDAQRLIDIIVANENFHGRATPDRTGANKDGPQSAAYDALTSMSRLSCEALPAT
jgi:hypothetical protein